MNLFDLSPEIVRNKKIDKSDQNVYSCSCGYKTKYLRAFAQHEKKCKGDR